MSTEIAALERRIKIAEEAYEKALVALLQCRRALCGDIHNEDSIVDLALAMRAKLAQFESLYGPLEEGRHTKMKRYLTFTLDDNNFSNHMQTALERLHDQFGEELAGCNPERFRTAMSALMAGEARAAAIMGDIPTQDSEDAWRAFTNNPVHHPMGWYFEYFMDARISRDPKDAKADQDNGAVSIDFSTSRIWVH